MRPASEIHTALDLLESEIDHRLELHASETTVHSQRELDNLLLVRHVIAWVTGERLDLDPESNAMWLATYLLDDPPRIEDVLPERN